MKRIIRGMAVLFLLAGIVFLPVSSGFAENPVSFRTQEVHQGSVEGGISSAEAAELFIRRTLSGESETGRKRGAAGYASLGQREKLLYDQLKLLIMEVANGDRSSTEFEIPLSAVFEDRPYTFAEMGTTEYPEDWFERLLDIPGVIRVLLVDEPYDLYWFDKTAGYSYGLLNGYFYLHSDSVEFADFDQEFICVELRVSSEYALNGNTLAYDTSWGQSAIAAAETARAIVAENASLGDIEKLTAYKNAICSLTDYNDDAAYGGVAYGNPWQMVWVFDNNPDTTVVCEGYSKAFQFLCDESEFQSANVRSILVSGIMAGGTGAGRHMWNVVTLADGRKYLADVTNSDDMPASYGDPLFLKRCSATEELTFNGETYRAYVFPVGETRILYGYNQDIIQLYGDGELSVLDVRISFDPGKGSGQMEPITVSAGEPFPAPSCSFTYNYGSFVHWVTGNQIIPPGESLIAENDLTLTAIWNSGENRSVTLKYYDSTQNKWNEEIHDSLYDGDPFVIPEPMGILSDTCVFQYWQGNEGPNQTGEWFTVNKDYIFSEVWEKDPGSGIFWSVNDSGVLTVSGNGEIDSCDYPIIEYGGIFLPWGLLKDEIDTLILEEGITAIGDGAFSDMYNITSVELPESLVSIGNRAFMECDSLAEIFFPVTLKTIGSNALTGCAPLQISYAGSPSQWAAVSVNPNNPVIPSPECQIFFELQDAESFRLDPEILDLYAGESVFLELCDIEPDEAVCEPVLWASSNEGVAVVDEDGCVTAVGIGAAEITASFNGVIASVTVTVSCDHQLTEYEQLDPTCTEPGIRAYWECDLCGKLFSDPECTQEIEEPVLIPMVPHTLEKIPGEEATCTEWGTATYWECSVCGKMFRDAEGHTEIREPEDIPPKGHHMTGYEKIEPACTEPGQEAYWECEVCGGLFLDEEGWDEIDAPVEIPPCGHDLTEYMKEEPTCTQPGTAAYFECNVCRKRFSDFDAQIEITEPAVLPALGHAWGETAYELDEDTQTVTASRVCERDGWHTVEETSFLFRWIVSPTEDTPGAVRRTAVFINGALDPWTETVVEIPALRNMNVLVLPAQLTAIEEEAFAGTRCEAVILPEGCERIEENAFADCPNLRYVWIPESVGFIDDSAFDDSELLILDFEAADWEPILCVTTDASSYDYGDSVELTAVLTAPDGTTGGIDESWPNTEFAATLLTEDGDVVPGYVVQTQTGTGMKCHFPMVSDDLAPGCYKILVETDTGLMRESPVFRYTADKSNLP